MIELLQEYWRPFLYSDGQHITGLAMTMWLLSAALVIGFLVSIPLSIARVSRNPLVRWPVQLLHLPVSWHTALYSVADLLHRHLQHRRRARTTGTGCVLSRCNELHDPGLRP